LLRAMLARGVRHAASSSHWDPMAALVCAEAGPGACIPLRLGGKCGPASGDPLDLVVTVRAVREEHTQSSLGGGRQRMGLTAWVEAQGIDIVINSLRTQTFAPDALTGLGIDLLSKRLIVVKSSQHFHAAFAPFADGIVYAATQGALSFDFAALPYVKRDGAYFPRIEDPLGLGRARSQ
jgi:microcystin degradation protein MlrC